MNRHSRGARRRYTQLHLRSIDVDRADRAVGNLGRVDTTSGNGQRHIATCGAAREPASHRREHPGDVTRTDIVRFADDVAAGKLKAGDLDSKIFESYLDTEQLPAADLLIRTSGEFRLSNFMLWQSAYAELVFLDVLWPDFGKDALSQAIDIFRGRDRRYGGSAPESA